MNVRFRIETADTETDRSPAKSSDGAMGGGSAVQARAG